MPLNDYGATRYIGSSAGAHLLDAFKTHQRYRISGQRSFLLENINLKNEELVIAKAKDVQKPSVHPRITQSIKVFQDIPGLDEEFVDHLIEAYFIFVHPSVPVLNKLSFLQQYYYQNPGPPDEYLISTICAIGVSFMFFDGDFVAGTKVDRRTLNSIYRHLLDKATKILGIAHHHPQISTLQTLLLLAIFITISAGDDDEEASMHWMIIGTVR
ncbi:hypothetical protein BJV82DRAFT_156677 [Fennellomyces sp. T-0311]|nr:hypothetical protein BJV82DRAFT_156677 [Fennellomyces sp. T-0311]